MLGTVTTDATVTEAWSRCPLPLPGQHADHPSPVPGRGLPGRL